jgi:hypothetical protein
MRQHFTDHRRDVVSGCSGADGLQVTAAAERAAFAFDHEHADIVGRLDLRAELFQFFGDRQIDRIEGTGTIERDRGDRAFDPEQRRIVGRGGGGMTGRRHLKSPRCQLGRRAFK